MTENEGKNANFFDELINKDNVDFQEHLREIYLDRLQRKLAEAYNLDIRLNLNKIKGKENK